MSVRRWKLRAIALLFLMLGCGIASYHIHPGVGWTGVLAILPRLVTMVFAGFGMGWVLFFPLEPYAKGRGLFQFFRDVHRDLRSDERDSGV